MPDFRMFQKVLGDSRKFWKSFRKFQKACRLGAPGQSRGAATRCFGMVLGTGGWVGGMNLFLKLFFIKPRFCFFFKKGGGEKKTQLGRENKRREQVRRSVGAEKGACGPHPGVGGQVAPSVVSSQPQTRRKRDVGIWGGRGSWSFLEGAPPWPGPWLKSRSGQSCPGTRGLPGNRSGTRPPSAPWPVAVCAAS